MSIAIDYTSIPPTEWERAPEHDRRIGWGDDWAGDAWRHRPTGTLRYVAVGCRP